MFHNGRYLILAALLFALPLLAQQDTGIITGEVLDESGAPVANASVEVKNVGTGIVSRISTGHEGSYTTQPLRIGSYSVTVETKGFKRAIREDLTVNVQDPSRVSFTLPLGEVQQSIETVAAA